MKKIESLREQFKHLKNDSGGSRFKILYDKHPTFSCIDDKFDRKDFEFVIGIEAMDKEEVFHIMQGFTWSPEGEARELIRALGLCRTSMSVGDVVFDKKDRKYYMVDSVGFKKVTRIN